MMTIILACCRRLTRKEASLDGGQMKVDFHSFEFMHESSAGCDRCFCKMMFSAINAKGNIQLLHAAGLVVHKNFSFPFNCIHNSTNVCCLARCSELFGQMF